jgi:hypothetical protein
MGQEVPGRFRRMITRLTATPEELEAEQLRHDAVVSGATPVADCGDRSKVTVSGTLRTVTLRPRAGVPALEAELFDGSGALSLVWLGRRQIPGIDPGRVLSATGRVSYNEGRPIMFNPRYELRSTAG